MFQRLADAGASAAPAGPSLRVDLVDEARRAFADAAPEIAGALVYLDRGVAEVAHHACGAGFFLGIGALNVLPLEEDDETRDVPPGRRRWSLDEESAASESSKKRDASDATRD